MEPNSISAATAFKVGTGGRSNFDRECFIGLVIYKQN